MQSPQTKGLRESFSRGRSNPDKFFARLFPDADASGKRGWGMTGQTERAAGINAPPKAAPHFSDWRSSEHGDGAGRTQFISFAIGDDNYGVDIMSVREIKGWSDVTTIPKQPEYVRGVLNLRGIMVPIIDLRSRFGQGLTEATPLHIIIIVQAGDRQVGLLGDRVLDIVSFEESQIQPVPRVAQAAHLDFLSGLITTPAGMMALIDLRNLLSPTADEPPAAR